MCAAAIAATAMLVNVPAGASACDRDCRIAAANSYLASLVSHDASQVPFHPDAWRIENGGARVEGGENIRAANEGPIMYVITGIHELAWYVDGDQAVSIYFLDTVAPTYITERFRVDDAGLITEIEAAFYIDAPGYVVGPESIASRPEGQIERFTESNHGPLGPIPVQEGNTGDDAVRAASSCGRACVHGAVDALLDALTSHDAASVPLADDAIFVANRRVVATDAAAVRAALSSSAITARADRGVFIDGEHAVAFTNTTVGGSTFHNAFHVRVVDGAIASISAHCDGSETCIE